MMEKFFKKIIDVSTARSFFRIKTVGLTLAVGILMALLSSHMTLERFELDALDHMFRAKPQRQGLSDIVFIDMAEDSLDQIGRWPWSRDWHATLINILSEYRARAVGLDILFSEEGESSQDNLLSEAIKKSGTVYLPFVFDIEGDRETGMHSPLPIFMESVKGAGFMNIFPDTDGMVRKAPLLILYTGTYYPQFAFKIACDYLGVKKEDIIINPGKNIILKNTKNGDITIPMNEKNEAFINWTGKWERSFKHYSYIDIIVSYKQKLEGIKPRIDLEELKGKTCLVGLTATGSSDLKPIPLEPLYPAVGVHANIIDNIVNKEFLVRANKISNILILIFVSFILGLVVPALKPLTGAVFSLSLWGMYLAFAFILFVFRGVWINLVYASGTVVLSYIAVTLFAQVTVAIEKARLFQLATRDGLTGLFVIRHFNLLLDAQIQETRGLKTPLCVIMSDIDHFKKFNDTYGHQTGDFVLREVANVFKAGCRQFDIPARYGGEEFIMMLPNTPIEGAKNLAERLRKTIENTDFKDNENRTYKVTVSLGVAAFEAEFNKEDLIKKADSALYKAKQGGRNQICVA